MLGSKMILTDSGGIQEEGPALNKPVLVLRDETERAEGCRSGVLKLIGTKKENIIKNTLEVYFNEMKYKEMVNSKNPFGDGLASDRIIKHLLELKINKK
jgi:UDP-N-acetylglucosamine 2-epimerase (non-hydrolysing)